MLVVLYTCLLSNTGKDDEESCVESSKENWDNDKRDVTNDWRPIREGVECRSTIVSECVKPSLHFSLLHLFEKLLLSNSLYWIIVNFLLSNYYYCCDAFIQSLLSVFNFLLSFIRFACINYRDVKNLCLNKCARRMKVRKMKENESLNKDENVSEC